MSIRIPYTKKQTIFGEVSNPLIVIQVLTQQGYQRFIFLIDSGADCTMVPRYMARLVGINLGSQPDTLIRGVEATRRGLRAYKGELKVRLGGEEFSLRCLITESDNTPLVLGRLDFFSKFNVTFDSTKEEVILEKIQ